jgi:hypothetical protein
MKEMKAVQIAVVNARMPHAKAMFCILILLPLANATPLPLPAALAAARMAEPEAVTRALTEVVRIDPTTEGGWLLDLRGFDGPERKELSGVLRGEGVGLADRSKLRRLVSAATKLTATCMEDGCIGMHDGSTSQSKRSRRRAQDGREESATNTQLKKQQGDHAGTAQPGGKETSDGSGLSADSASP